MQEPVKQLQAQVHQLLSTHHLHRNSPLHQLLQLVQDIENQPEQSRGSSLGVVVHEMGNYLFRLNSCLTLLQRPRLKKNQRERFQMMLERQWKDLEELCQRFGQSPSLFDQPRQQHVDINQLLQNCLNQYQALFPAQNFQAVYTGALNWFVDPFRLQQVLHNLLGNACKFAPHATVSVGTEENAHTERIFVSDTGPGISKAHQARVFEPFMQVTPESGKGVGLGLSIAQHLCQQMDLELCLESSPGQGSSFWIEKKK